MTGDEPPRDPATGQFIPRSRFNEINNRLKAAEAELAALKNRPATEPPAPTPPAPVEPEVPTFDFDAAEAEYIQLVLDGKTAEAQAKRREIRQAERDDYIAAARQTTTEVTNEQRISSSIESVANSYTEKFDQLNPDSDNFNQELMDDIKDVYAGALQSGRYADPIEAWDKSIQKALRMHGLDPSGKPPPAPKTPAKAPGTPAARVAATAATPPVPAGTGTAGAPAGTVQIDLATMTAEDFAKLPPATQARLRGDIVE